MLSTAETAAKLGVSVQRVRQMIGEGKLHPSKVGSQYAFRPSDVEQARQFLRTAEGASSADKG